MRSLEDLKKILNSELEKINKKGDITAAELEIASKVVCILEKIAKIDSIEGGSYGEDGYSERRYSNNSVFGGYYWPDRMSYNNGNSYRGNDYPMRGRSSSYDNRGYSMHDEKEMLIRKMEDLLQDAQSEKERKAIIDHIEYLKN